MTGDADRLAELAKETHILLTTFKRDGTTASTPVWVVSDDGRRLLVWSGATTWKVKRIRRDPRVRVAPCNMTGKVRGETLEGTARLLGPDAGQLVDGLLSQKYRYRKKFIDGLNAFLRMLSRKPKPPSEYIEIVAPDRG